MSPIQLIREGIIESDWKKVEAGYSAMTGEVIAFDRQAIVATIKKNKRGSKKKEKKESIEINQVMEPTGWTVTHPLIDGSVKSKESIEDLIEKFKVPVPQPNPNAPDGDGKLYARKVPLFKHPEKFKPTKEFLEDTKIDKALTSKIQPSPRNRESSLIVIKCFKCKKDVELPFDLASKYGDGSSDNMKPTFFCNSCS